MNPRATRFFARNLTAALLAGPWEAATMRDRAIRAWGQRPHWMRGLVKRVKSRFPSPPRDDELLVFLLADDHVRHGLAQLASENRRRARRIEITLDRPPVPTVTDSLPDLPTAAALAAWLGLTPGQLTCYADIKRQNRFHDSRNSKRHHYRYHWVPKRGASRPTEPSTESGPFRRLIRRIALLLGFGTPPQPRYRLLEIPKPRLKKAQRKIHADILSKLTPHPAAHGFRVGCSIASNAAPHCGKLVVLRFDISDFFTSIPASRVKGVFVRLGYSPEVARLLAGLCTNCTNDTLAAPRYPATRMPRTEWQAIERLFARPHLPQGAPTSPVLANLCAYRLDCRLAGLAARLGANYTRYADDLTFSGGVELLKAAKRVRKLVTAIATDEGFAINPEKCRVLRRGTRQAVTGVVVNVKPNVRRAEFDRLKATLTNCIRHGPKSQNRENHPDFRACLTGRVAHVAHLNPARGARLRALLVRIDWSR